MSGIDGPAPPAQPTFEELVAALLQVDPEGITGQTAGKGKKAAGSGGEDE